jgi:hypothetical protein
VIILANGSAGFPDPRYEHLELRDFGAPDLTPTPAAAVTWSDMEQAGRPDGYVDAVCLGCGCALFVPANERAGDVLCTECRRNGEAIAAEEDSDPDPKWPGGAALDPDDPAYYVRMAGRMSDDQLLAGIGIADTSPHQLLLRTPHQRGAFLNAFSAELLRRLGEAA